MVDIKSGSEKKSPSISEDGAAEPTGWWAVRLSVELVCGVSVRKIIIGVIINSGGKTR